MKKNLLSLLLLLFYRRVRKFDAYRLASVDLARLKMSLLYIKGIKTSRLLLINLLGMVLCLVFLITSLIIFHTTLFLYAPWSIQTKMVVGILFATIYLLISIWVFLSIFSQDKWLHIFHADHMIDRLRKKSYQGDGSKNNGYDRREEKIERDQETQDV